MRRTLVSGVAVATLLMATPASAIVYGTTTAEHDNVAAVVAVLATDAGPETYVWCTGTLVDADTVVSAAHCFPTWEEIRSSLPPRFTGIEYTVAFAPDGVVDTEPLLTGTWHLHEGFPGPASDLHDVAVFELDDPDAVDSITPATVAPVGHAESIARAHELTTVGYGDVRDTRRQAWQALRGADGQRHVAEQPMLSLTRAWLTLSMNDARDHGGTCYGDSGGPHFHGGMLVSLTVTGDTNCKATDKTYRLDTPAVHAFLEPFMDGVELQD